MTALHVVYRVDDAGSADEQWSCHSFPHAVFVGGASLDEVRSEFREAAMEAVSGFETMTVLEHLERPLVRGSYIRVAVDRRMLDRDATAELMRGSLAPADQRDDFIATLPVAATGDAIMIVCTPADRLGWVLDQMSEFDTVGVCAAGPALPSGTLVWWSFIVGHHAVTNTDRDLETLASAGLSRDSTVVEFMAANQTATGRTLVGA